MNCFIYFFLLEGDLQHAVDRNRISAGSMGIKVLNSTPQNWQ